jgi:hypothetical protein
MHSILAHNETATRYTPVAVGSLLLTTSPAGDCLLFRREVYGLDDPGKGKIGNLINLLNSLGTSGSVVMYIAITR